MLKEDLQARCGHRARRLHAPSRARTLCLSAPVIYVIDRGEVVEVRWAPGGWGCRVYEVNTRSFASLVPPPPPPGRHPRRIDGVAQGPLPVACARPRHSRGAAAVERNLVAMHARQL